MSAKRVLSVGQCGFDHGQIRACLQKHFGAEVVEADSSDEALRKVKAEAFDLVLVNRVFDRDGSSGLAFLKELKASSPTPCMLVSNFEEAQQEAVEAGALPGFGKSALEAGTTRSRLAAALS